MTDQVDRRTALPARRWTELWKGLRHSAFRLEAQPSYVLPGEEETLRRFAVGSGPQAGYHADWHERLRAWREGGVTVQRVRLLTDPPTDYQRLQLAHVYPGHRAAGEQVLVLWPDSPAAAALPAQDFWLLDDRLVVLLHYGPDGKQTGLELVPDAELADWQRYRDVALAGAVPAPV